MIKDLEKNKAITNNEKDYLSEATKLNISDKISKWRE